jgi:O-antigen/teichoic acid export membrane protein
LEGPAPSLDALVDGSAASVTLATAAGADAASAPAFDPAVTTAPVSLFGQRARRWAGILTAYFGTQSVTQVLGILAGLLFVRYMPVKDYALYTLASSIITFFTFTTDLGSTTSLLHFYQRARSAGEPFAPYLTAVLSLRRIAFVLGALVVAIALPAVALTKGFRPLDVSLATAAVIAAVGFQIVSAVRVLALRLEDRFGHSYRAEMSGAALRLVLASAMVVAAVLHAWLGVAVAAAGSALTALLARSPASESGGTYTRTDLRPYRRAIVRYMLPTLPGALYYAIQGPLLVWLAAAFGGTRNIAEVGALGRLGLLVGIFSGLTGVVFLPRLARITDERLFRRRALAFGAVHLLLASAMLGAALLLPEVFLWLLGGHYVGLHRELDLVVLGAGLSLLDGYFVSLNLARSWTRFQGLAVVSVVVGDVSLMLLLHLQTSAGILTFNAASAAVALLGQLCITTAGFVRPSSVLWDAGVRGRGDEMLSA